MATNFVQEGCSLNYTNGTGNDIAGGDVVVYGSLLGVAETDIPDGETGTVHVEGVWNLPKATGTALDAGDRVYWDADNSLIKKTKAAGYVLAGTVTDDAASGDTTVNVRLVGATLSAEDSAAQADNVAELGATSNITSVPGSFADVAAVRTYLLTIVPEIEARLDAVEAKGDEVIGSLVDAEIMAGA